MPRYYEDYEDYEDSSSYSDEYENETQNESYDYSIPDWFKSGSENAQMLENQTGFLMKAYDQELLTSGEKESYLAYMDEAEKSLSDYYSTLSDLSTYMDGSGNLDVTKQNAEGLFYKLSDLSSKMGDMLIGQEMYDMVPYSSEQARKFQQNRVPAIALGTGVGHDMIGKYPEDLTPEEEEKSAAYKKYMQNAGIAVGDNLIGDYIEKLTPDEEAKLAAYKEYMQNAGVAVGDNFTGGIFENRTPEEIEKGKEYGNEVFNIVVEATDPYLPYVNANFKSYPPHVKAGVILANVGNIGAKLGLSANKNGDVSEEMTKQMFLNLVGNMINMPASENAIWINEGLDKGYDDVKDKIKRYFE